MKFRFVQYDKEAGFIVTDFPNEENLIAGMSIRNAPMTGRHSSPHTRKELANHPKFSGVVGPMWGGEEGGEIVIRYEDKAAYDTLSQ